MQLPSSRKDTAGSSLSVLDDMPKGHDINYDVFKHKQYGFDDLNEKYPWYDILVESLKWSWLLIIKHNCSDQMFFAALLWQLYWKMTPLTDLIYNFVNKHASKDRVKMDSLFNGKFNCMHKMAAIKGFCFLHNLDIGYKIYYNNYIMKKCIQLANTYFINWHGVPSTPLLATFNTDYIKEVSSLYDEMKEAREAATVEISEFKEPKATPINSPDVYAVLEEVKNPPFTTYVSAPCTMRMLSEYAYDTELMVGTHYVNDIITFTDNRIFVKCMKKRAGENEETEFSEILSNGLIQNTGYDARATVENFRTFKNNLATALKAVKPVTDFAEMYKISQEYKLYDIGHIEFPITFRKWNIEENAMNRLIEILVNNEETIYNSYKALGVRIKNHNVRRLSSIFWNKCKEWATNPMTKDLIKFGVKGDFGAVKLRVRFIMDDTNFADALIHDIVYLTVKDDKTVTSTFNDLLSSMSHVMNNPHFVRFWRHNTRLYKFENYKVNHYRGDEEYIEIYSMCELLLKTKRFVDVKEEDMKDLIFLKQCYNAKNQITDLLSTFKILSKAVNKLGHGWNREDEISNIELKRVRQSTMMHLPIRPCENERMNTHFFYKSVSEIFTKKTKLFKYEITDNEIENYIKYSALRSADEFKILFPKIEYDTRLKATYIPHYANAIIMERDITVNQRRLYLPWWRQEKEREKLEEEAQQREFEKDVRNRKKLRLRDESVARAIRFHNTKIQNETEKLLPNKVRQLKSKINRPLKMKEAKIQKVMDKIIEVTNKVSPFTLILPSTLDSNTVRALLEFEREKVLLSVLNEGFNPKGIPISCILKMELVRKKMKSKIVKPEEIQGSKDLVDLFKNSSSVKIKINRNKNIIFYRSGLDKIVKGVKRALARKETAIKYTSAASSLSDSSGYYSC
jgi:hypothetical protein